VIRRFVRGIHIFPLAFETTGKFGEDALALTKRIGRQIAIRTGEDRATSFIRQRISIEIQRGNAQSILETSPAYGDLRDAMQQ
jgi:predicted ATPase